MGGSAAGALGGSLVPRDKEFRIDNSQVSVSDTGTVYYCCHLANANEFDLLSSGVTSSAVIV